MTLVDLALLLVVFALIVALAAARQQTKQLRDMLAKQAQKADQLTDFQRLAELRLDAVIDAPPHVLLALDRDGRISRANSRAKEILGEKVIGLTVIEATRSYEIDAVVQITLGQQRIEERPVTWNAKPYFARAVPIDDGGAVLALEDQADRLRLERARRDFVANVSHELRTPLASVRLLIETLLNGALEEPEMAARMLNQMLGEVDSITQLAQELLDLSMIESGQMPMQIARVNLHEIIDEQIIHYEAMTQQKRLTVEDDVSTDLVAEIDRKMIGRVLGNLIHNAIKFTPDRGRISIAATPVDDKIKVSVADTGVGIPQEDLPRIFERFYKVDRARGKSGTGLGLAIARHVVEAHGGRIWAESVEGKGATFCFTLPAAK
ncbi:MAG: cell wall metabolism sensor histidine kinase WalK [Chloroflexi bacterium]|nr:cell wall metabolism sensor histidine kinase WalK [Chloroflexota bacterium]